MLKTRDDHATSEFKNTAATTADSRPTLVHVVRDPEISGSQRVALNILGDPAFSEFRRIIICGRFGDVSTQFLDETRRLGIEPVYIERLRRKVGLHDIGAFIDILRTLKAIKPVLVHTHSVKPFLLAGIAAWVLRVPCRIHTLHGISFHRFTPVIPRIFNFLLEQFASLFYHRIVSVNEYYRRFFPLARLCRSIVVIPNGIALPNYVPQSRAAPGNEFAILFAGRLDEQKDPEFLLDVAESIERYWHSDSMPRFYIAGAGPLTNHIVSEIESRGLAHKVTLLGWVSDLSDQYASAEVCFLTSRWEACGLVLIEAAAHGCPAVASSVEGVPEVIRDEHNGLLFEQGDIASACRCLARLASDNNLLSALAEQARIEAQSRDVDTMRARYVDLYRSLALPV